MLRHVVRIDCNSFHRTEADRPAREGMSRGDYGNRHVSPYLNFPTGSDDDGLARGGFQSVAVVIRKVEFAPAAWNFW